MSDTKNHNPPGSYHKFRTEGHYLKFKNWLPEEGIDYDIIQVFQGDNFFHFRTIEELKKAIQENVIELDYKNPWTQMTKEPDLWKEKRQISVHYMMSKKQCEQRRKEQEKRDKERESYYASCTFGTIEEAIKYINKEVKNKFNNQQQ
jgi:hypothetical protein